MRPRENEGDLERDSFHLVPADTTGRARLKIINVCLSFSLFFLLSSEVHELDVIFVCAIRSDLPTPDMPTMMDRFKS